MLKASFFLRNRKNFSKVLPKNSLFILTEHEPYADRDSEFYNKCDKNIFYLTGIEQEETKFIIHKDSRGKITEKLFIRENNPTLETWEGKKLSIKDARKISGMNQIKSSRDFDEELVKLVKKTKILLSIFDHREMRRNYPQEKLVNSLKRKYKLKYENLFDIISKLRNIKSKEEIELLKKSAEISNKAFRNVMKNIKKIKTEQEVEAYLSFVYTKNLCSHSYHPIVASGISACTLHYIENNQKLKKGDLLLIDSGAEFNRYKSDVTRTFPIRGKFTKRQKEVYIAVLDIQKYALKILKVGITQREWETKIAIETLEKIKKLSLEKNLKIDLKNKHSINILRKYYPHGTGHFLGLDTHDLGDYNEPFQENQVITVEPALYIEKEKIGIRIEDNVLLKKKGNVVLTKNIPKEIRDIEKLTL